MPGFRILEKLPLYRDIRAPHDFFEMGGVFCFSVAAGIAAYLLVRAVAQKPLRLALAAGLLALASADGASIVASFFKAPMDRKTFDDFLAAQKFLREDALTGSVLPFSGRCFYLLTPILSGRDIVNEAFNSHLMARGLAELQSQAFSSKRSFATFVNIGGISHLLLDKQDPDTAKDLQDALREQFKVAYENDHFAILKNPEAFSPGGFASNFATSPEEGVADFGLAAAAQGLAAISGCTSYGDNDGQMELNAEAFSTLVKVPDKDIQQVVPGHWRVMPPAKTGWVVIPKAWHPDWKAVQSGKPVEIAKAFGAYLALRVKSRRKSSTCNFSRPGGMAHASG